MRWFQLLNFCNVVKLCKLMRIPINRTNKGFQRAVRAVGQEHGLRKKLEPYSPNAPRNRPKETVCVSVDGILTSLPLASEISPLLNHDVNADGQHCWLQAQIASCDQVRLAGKSCLL